MQGENDIFMRSIDRINDTIAKFSPPHIFFAYSGGKDSAAICEILRNVRSDIKIPYSVMSIDTGLQSLGHIERIKEDMLRADLPLEIYTGGGLDWWEKNVAAYGYAYTPSQHVIYYRSLKERAIDKSVKSKKTKYHQKIVSVTGVRRAESQKRAETPIVYHSQSARVTLNIIADISEEERDAVLIGANWYHGRSTEDCMCNWTMAFNSESPMNIDMKASVDKLDKEMESCGLWKYGERPSKEQISIFHDVRSEIMPIDSYCVNCVGKSPH